MRGGSVVVIGAGMGGLAAALELSAAGFAVDVLERAASPGGKLREVQVDGPGGSQPVDAGPTVLTLKPVFDSLFAAAGTRLDQHLQLEPADVLARNVWADGSVLDLHRDPERTADGIGRLAGAAEAQGFREFLARAARIHDALQDSFIRRPSPSFPGLLWRTPIADQLRLSPYSSLWDALGRHFRDPRLRQLFARYASYCGSSPYAAPATLMLIAHVEQQGVWLVPGGMHRLATALVTLASAHGARFHFGAEATGIRTERGRVARVHLASGDTLPAQAVVVNADVSAVANGLFGREAAGTVPDTPAARRSLSAVTWCLRAHASGLPLVRHTVFHAPESRSEFADALGNHRLPRAPSVYLCAQDRGGADESPGADPERFLCVVNAPANGDAGPPDSAALADLERAVFGLLERCDLRLKRDPRQAVQTTPADFARLYPATGGALYGPVSHGWRASFRRAGVRSRLPGLYLAGGSVHPGAGLPMAALSGQLAAWALIGDHGSRVADRPT